MRNATLAIAALLVPGAASAGGYVVPNLNARDLAMAGSAVGAQDSAAAAYQNPAALAKLSGFHLSLGLALIDFRSTWSDSYEIYDQAPVTMIDKGAFPPALYAAYGWALPNQMRLGVGGGLTIPGGGYVFWPGGWFGRTDVITVDRKVYGGYLTAGLEVLPQLRVGGGLVYYRTTEHIKQGLNLLSQEGQIELGTSGGALSFDASLEATPFRGIPLTLAVDYKHQGVQHLSGHAHGTDVPLALQPGLLDQEIEHTLTYPNQLNVGIAWQLPVAPLLLTAGWTWERFHVYQEDTFTGSRGAHLVVPRDYKNGYTLRFGGEFQALQKLKLRVGILRDISPSRPETVGPSLPDSDVTALAFGVGVALRGDLEIAAAWFHAFYDSIQTAGNEVLQGRYDTRANIWSVSLVWRTASP